MLTLCLHFNSLASALCRHISGLVGLKWELRGQEHLEKEQACIIVANHQSSLDILGKSFIVLVLF
jgi:1-acyl-sn-glycerol-3-phosphate acyltransferase